MSSIPSSFGKRSFTFRDTLQGFLLHNDLPFASLLDGDRIRAVFQNHASLSGGIYTTAIALWAFQSQVLRDDKEASLIANEEPPRPLYKGCRFTTLLLFADSSFVRSDGMKVHLYRMIPLTTSEREYEQKRGLKAFMQALDKHDVPTIVDMNRKPFA